jgi:hypothetical protein
MTPVAKYMARSGAIHRNHIKAVSRNDPPPQKWSDLSYVFDIQEDCNGKERRRPAPACRVHQTPW